MKITRQLSPKKVFEFFEEICAIPHGSGNTAKIADYCVDFAKKRNLQYKKDALNDVIIIKPATSGYENASTVIIQGHLDMVCEKAAGKAINFETEGISLQTDGEYLYADGTTLGGDDGIAIAYALALLDDDSIIHPRIEAVFTVDEETGMYGADFIDVSNLRGKIILNADSENEGVFTVGCAGGAVLKTSLPKHAENFFGTLCTLSVSGLTGGHSGVEIHKGRANAIDLLARLLCRLEAISSFSLASISGGSKDNAIPTDANAQLIVTPEEARLFAANVKKCAEELQNEYTEIESHMSITFSIKETIKTKAMSPEATKALIAFLTAMPSGVIAMNNSIRELVKTSLNPGILSENETAVTVTFLIRSSIDSEKQALIEKLSILSEICGGTASVISSYPGWAYKKDSDIRSIFVDVYKKLYQKEPIVETIHAGLECGIFCAKIDGADCISFGPDILDIHTVKERMPIASVKRVWEFILAVLSEICNLQK